MNFIQSQIEFIKTFGKSYLSGAIVTLELSLIGVILGLLIGLLICFMRLSKSKILQRIATIYVDIIRGTPMLVQLFIFYYGLKSIIPQNTLFFRNSMFLCSIAICINSSAYISEVLRGGILSVNKGQMEAARSLGLSQKQAMQNVILPQALKNILPSLVNEFISLIKETAIVLNVGIADLTYSANVIRGTTFESIRPFIYSAIIYFVMTYSLSKAMKALERRLSAQ